MKIAIDCRALRKSPSGIPNFIVSAINGLANTNPDWEFYLLSNEPFHPALTALLDNKPNIKVIIQPMRYFNKIAIIWLYLKVDLLLKKLQPDLYWAPAFLLPPVLPSSVKTLVTVHDMVFKDFKNTMSIINRLLFELFHDSSLNKADLLWANSAYTKRGIKKYFPNRKCKKVFTGFFINTTVFKQTALTSKEKKEILAHYELEHKFILFVGTLEPRKNLHFLLSLMPDLAILGFSLLIIGAKGWGDTRIQEMVHEPGFPGIKVKFASYVSTPDLVKLYSLARVYVSTSLNEGFGMPQLEAMACGCPVISPHNSAMIEVVEGAGETIKTWEKNDWIAAIELVSKKRNKYINLGFKRVKYYERKRIIQDLTKYINSVILVG